MYLYCTYFIWNYSIAMSDIQDVFMKECTSVRKLRVVKVSLWHIWSVNNKCIFAFGLEGWRHLVKVWLFGGLIAVSTIHVRLWLNKSLLR